jgi:predicted membrane chloride channel (bestrophin family)
VNAPIAVRLIVTLLLLAAIVTMSVVPGRTQPGDSVFVWLVSVTPSPLQKMMHFVTYAVLAMLWLWTLEIINSMSLRVALALVITVTLGLYLEWYQTSVPGRYGTLADAILNAFGAIAGLLVATLLL